MEIIGKYLRLLLLWMAWAISSLPVPLSPRINTVASVLATTATISRIFLVSGLSPIILVLQDQFLHLLPELNIFADEPPLVHGITD